MRTTLQRNVRIAACSVLLLLSALGAAGQGTFQNLGFENTTLTVVLINPGYPISFYATNATVPGWRWSPQETFGYGDPNTTVAFDNEALDSSAVTLHDRNDSFAPAISGNYSILLQGGSQFFPQQYGGASIFQTGSIPVTARSLVYLGGAALQVSFNGQSLSPVALGTAPGYTTWGIDISPYAGQSGALRFVVPWLTSSMLDGIQFSSAPIPEPSVLPLGILGLISLAVSARRANKRLEPTRVALPVYPCVTRRAAQAQRWA